MATSDEPTPSEITVDPAPRPFSSMTYNPMSCELTVEFENGSAYTYQQLPPSEFYSFRASGFSGSAFAAIKRRYRRA